MKLLLLLATVSLSAILAPKPRKLMVMTYREERRKNYEMSRFKKQFAELVQELNQRQETTKEFSTTQSQAFFDLSQKFLATKDDIDRMKDDSLLTINGAMTTLGIGLG